MRKQFNLKDWLKDKSQKVETRDGRLVHNIWRVKEPFYTNNRKAEVCALIDGEEDALVFFEGGRYLPTAKDTDNPFDLFIVTPEEEMTGFERRIKDLLAIKCEIFYNEDIGGCYDLKGLCRVILECAREQLKPEIEEALEKAYRNADEVQYKKGWEDAIDDHREALRAEYEKGRADALKDLPRWKKVGLDTGQTTLVVGYTKDEDKLYRNGYVISLIDLEKLPKEESHE